MKIAHLDILITMNLDSLYDELSTWSVIDKLRKNEHKFEPVFQHAPLLERYCSNRSELWTVCSATYTFQLNELAPEQTRSINPIIAIIQLDSLLYGFYDDQIPLKDDLCPVADRVDRPLL